MGGKSEKMVNKFLFGTRAAIFIVFATILFAGSCGSGSGNAGGKSPPPGGTSLSLISTSPQGGAVNVSIEAIISVVFSDAVDPLTVTATTFLLKQGAAVVPGAVTINGNVAIFTPNSQLTNDATYNVTVTTGVKGLAGDTFASDNSWTFTTSSGSPQPPGMIITIADGAMDGSTLGIPRYKIHQNLQNPSKIWATFKNTRNDNYFTEDAGNTWQGINHSGWDYHVSMAGDSVGNIHIAAPNFDSRGGVIFQRLASPATQLSHFEGPIVFQDFGTTLGVGNVSVSGTEVYLFTRAYGGVPPIIMWHRSVDNGITFTSSGIVCNPSSAHRIGSCVINGSPNVVIWESGVVASSITFYRWNGSTFVSDGGISTGSNSIFTREYSVTQDSNGYIHLVWWDIVGGVKCLRHSYRIGSGSWSSPSTIDSWDNDLMDPQLTHYGGKVFVFYRFNNGNYTGIFYKTWNSPSSGWSVKTEVSLPNGECRFPQVPQHVNMNSKFIPVIWVQAPPGEVWGANTNGQIKYRAISP